MLIAGNIINNKKTLISLKLRGLFFSLDLVCFFVTIYNKMSEIDNLRINLINSGLNHQFFNSYFTNLNNFSNLNLYFSFLKSPFFVIYLNSFLDLDKLNFENCFLLSCFYRGYFLNNSFFCKLSIYYGFFHMNYLFFVSYFMFLPQLFFNSILCIKFLFIAHMKLRIEQLNKKSYQLKHLNFL